mmetsp:Transcript_14521/g.40373  ORF Transcript_14521/g.40373 Transcript_14521/m.40373 type:complete len:521 (-) Transcript_14521:222-1784(-)|eukprot:CAMPEP_0172368774 /NCGR_PEP_ID=MMETSP1060-20121228/29335_1 /TAXON_ID=37318 /ORGANISM="Pseudo-nitzschia pungens, Strain cf. cingulata" /LENGTH=520 /DNA_ID=CAMNT_0013093493 /DNA_START=171 /DNA_END=1733 /DNA_ORIENTATION=+
MTIQATTTRVLCLLSASLLLFATLEPALSFSTTTTTQGSVTKSASRVASFGKHNVLFASSAADNAGKTTTIPSDPAKTTAQFLAGLWRLIAKGNHMFRGESETLLFPEMAEQMTKPRFLNLVTAHLDACKDVCDFFGISTTLVPYVQNGKVLGFTVKSFRNPDKDPNNLEFAYDPFWDEADDWDYEGIDAEYEKEEGGENNAAKVEYPEIVNKVPDNNEEIEQLSRDWVAKICSDMGVCPFTSGADQAGLPMGPVYYTTDRSSSFEDMYAVYWDEVVRVEQQSEKDLSTTLLITPEFCMDNVELFETWSTTLTQPLSALEIENTIQLVFFHPYWTFRDGGERGGEGAAANYARRSPWPMINILRTNQVRAAQKGIPTGLVYKQNESTLTKIGVEKLETMLRLRDWGDIADVKVDRRQMEALRVAQDFQKTGVIKQEDKSFENDATPAVNKVDGSQIDQGDLVNVIREGLGKRLGKGEERTGVQRLSGPETSATIMASDFLIAELEKIVADTAAEEERAVA